MHLEIDLLRRIGLSQATLAQLGQALTFSEGNQPLTTPDGTRLMRVTETQRDRHTLHDGRDEHVARLMPAVHHALQARDDQLTIGDWSWPAPTRTATCGSLHASSRRRRSRDAPTTAGASRSPATSTRRCW